MMIQAKYPHYREHLDLLEEWNEETTFSATSTAVLMTDLGVQVVQDVQQRNREYRDGRFVGLGEPTLIHVWAIYGDDDELCRLIIAENGQGPRADTAEEILKQRPRNEVLVNKLIRG
jgi:hypothetical protein